MPTVTPTGTLQAKIAIVSERPGTAEIEAGEPFVGTSGDELDRMLLDAGLLTTPRLDKNYYTWMRKVRQERRETLYITNVFHEAPPGGDIELWCAAKGVVVEEYDALRSTLEEEYPDFPWPTSYTWGNIGKGGKYLRPKYLRCLPRLREELSQLKECNVVIALGAISCWALLGEAGIKKSRGYTTLGTLVPDLKVLPTYHPAFVLRFWQSRVIAIADFKKAQRQSAYPELRVPQCKIWINPTIEDLYEFDELYLKDASEISVDIETKMEQVRCVGFAPSTEIALVVPFLDLLKRGYSYWKNPEDEIKAWLWVAEVLARPMAKIGQNFNFDLQYLWQKMGMPVSNVAFDSLLAHHSLQPEMEKSLGFLASLYTDAPTWKHMRGMADADEKED